MVGLAALWMPILVSAVFVFIALSIIHAMLGWHKGDMTMVPGEDKVMETLRGLNVQPGDYRFPYSNSVDETKTPAFAEKMKEGPVGFMSILPSGDVNMGKLLGQWFVYSLFIAVIVAYVTGRGAVAFCCYVVAHWQNWIWWGKSTRFTVTNSLDGIIYALVTGATFGWLWPK